MNGAARAGMPWLSEDLAGPRDPRLCQACGAAGDVRAWQEHDDADSGPLSASSCSAGRAPRGPSVRTPGSTVPSG